MLRFCALPLTVVYVVVPGAVAIFDCPPIRIVFVVAGAVMTDDCKVRPAVKLYPTPFGIPCGGYSRIEKGSGADAAPIN
jgi:hypothetical protein